MENQTPASVPQGLPPTPSKVIARLTHFVTFVIFGGFSIEFFSRGAIKPISQISILYTSLLTAYAGEKEVRRWNSLIPEETRGGKGDYIVSLWFLFYIFCWAIASLKPVYKIPANLLTACLSVLTIFVGSKASKRFYQGKLRKGKNLPKPFLQGTIVTDPSPPLTSLTEEPLSEETEPVNNNNRITLILDYLKKNGKITRENAAQILRVSKTTAWRLLRFLADQGKIKWVGKWDRDPEGYYVLPEETNSGVS